MLRSSLPTALLVLLPALPLTAQAQGTDAWDRIEFSLRMNPRPSPYLSDWAMKRETVTLQVRNMSSETVQARVNATYTLSGRVTATTDVEMMPVLSIPPGTTLFDGEQTIVESAVRIGAGIREMTIRSGMLPAGPWELCIELVPVDRDPRGKKACAPFFIVEYQRPVPIPWPTNVPVFIGAQLSIVQVESGLPERPPVVADIPPIEGPVARSSTHTPLDPTPSTETHSDYMSEENMRRREKARAAGGGWIPTWEDPTWRDPRWGEGPTFRWTPVAPAPEEPVRYVVSVFELVTGQTVIESVTGNTPLFRAEVDQSTSLPWPMELTPLIHSGEYAWMVDAARMDGSPIGPMIGSPEVARFWVGGGSGVVLVDHPKDWCLYEVPGWEKLLCIPCSPEPCPMVIALFHGDASIHHVDDIRVGVLHNRDRGCESCVGDEDPLRSWMMPDGWWLAGIEWDFERFLGRNNDCGLRGREHPKKRDTPPPAVLRADGPNYRECRECDASEENIETLDVQTFARNILEARYRDWLRTMYPECTISINVREATLGSVETFRSRLAVTKLIVSATNFKIVGRNDDASIAALYTALFDVEWELQRTRRVDIVGEIRWDCPLLTNAAGEHHNAGVGMCTVRLSVNVCNNNTSGKQKGTCGFNKVGMPAEWKNGEYVGDELDRILSDPLVAEMTRDFLCACELK